MLFRAKSVATITAKLSDIVTDLRAHAGREHGAGNQKREEAERLRSEAGAHQIESDHALTVASKIEALLT